MALRLSSWVKQVTNSEDLLSSPASGLEKSTKIPGSAHAPDARPTSSAEEVAAPRWVGFVDRVCPDAIHGWAYDAHHPEACVTVEAVTEGGKRSLAVANLLREDVAAAGFGTGKYGYVLSLVGLGLRDETVTVRFAESKNLISPEPIEFDAQRALLSQTMPSAFINRMVLLAAQIRAAAETSDRADALVR